MVMRRDRWRGRTIVESADEHPQRCVGAKHRYDYDANVSILTIPPICLNRAPWVRVAEAAAHIGGDQAFVDHAFAKGMPTRPPISALVWRG